MNPLLPDLLAQRLTSTLPGSAAQRRMEPSLSYGRHTAEPPPDARAAAVLILLYREHDRWHLPLIVRPGTMQLHAGQIGFPGGLIEPGETSDVAALRELEEELGVSVGGVRLLGRLSPLYLFVTNFSVEPWVGVADELPPLSPNPDEVDEVLHVPLDHLLDPANIDTQLKEHRGLSYQAPHFLWQTHQIWGATSMMLAEFLAVVEPLGI